MTFSNACARVRAPRSPFSRVHVQISPGRVKTPIVRAHHKTRWSSSSSSRARRVARAGAIGAKTSAPLDDDDDDDDDGDARLVELRALRERWESVTSTTRGALAGVPDAGASARTREDASAPVISREDSFLEITAQREGDSKNEVRTTKERTARAIRKSPGNAKWFKAASLAVGTLAVFGSVAQGSSVDGAMSAIVRRLVSIALIRFIIRRAYYVLRDAFSAVRAFYVGPVSRARTRAWDKFRGDLKGMLFIPVVAASVGWFTNWLAVQMIFYPIGFWGLPLLQYVEGQVYGFDILQPLGFFGWQGIVPAKAAMMSMTMVTMVTEKLVNVQEVFRLLDPAAVSSLLLTQVPAMASSIASEMIPDWVRNLAESAVPALPSATLNEMSSVISSYLAGFVMLLQQQVDAVIDLKELVVTAMCTDRVVMVDLFRQCGAKELAFLVDSGLFFGFLLGLIQMVVWAFYDNPWSITAGGAIVGLLTNWLALKCIFEPVDPVFVGPFKLQGLFLQRQQEVSGTFSDFLTSKVLKSERIWDNMLNGAKGPEFKALLEKYTKDFVVAESAARGMPTDGMDIKLIEEVATKVAEKLPEHIGVLHQYTDETLGLQTLIRERMKLMSPAEFERVLHPIFEQDELTLIISGAVLGAIAGYIQQVTTIKKDQ